MNKRPNYKQMCIKNVLMEQDWEKSLKKASENVVKNFDKTQYDLGTTWALQGMELEDAGELANNKSFTNGYARGKRLLLISELDNEDSKKVTR